MVNFGCHGYVVNCYNEEYFWKKKEKAECWYYQLTHKSKKKKSTVNRTLHSPCN